MAFVKNPVAGVLAANIIEDTAAAATAQANVLSGATTLYMVRIDNTANSTETVYLKIYDATSATVGTTRPSGIFSCPASSSRQYSVPDGITFSAGITYAVVRTAGLQGAVNPSATVKVYLATA
tara:strand:+ start:1253 stop:1621 length:369 start_codon:yes stop_codon:yes gene_type:complete